MGPRAFLAHEEVDNEVTHSIVGRVDGQFFELTLRLRQPSDERFVVFLPANLCFLELSFILLIAHQCNVDGLVVGRDLVLVVTAILHLRNRAEWLRSESFLNLLWLILGEELPNRL